MTNPVYNGTLVLISLMYCIAFFFVDVESSVELLKRSFWVELPAFLLTILYLVDLVANLIVMGCKGMWRERRILCLEVFLQFCFWLSYMIDFMVFNETTILGRFVRINSVF